MKEDTPYIRGRGAQINPQGEYEKKSYETICDDYRYLEEQEELLLSNKKTEFLQVHPKTILNKTENMPFGYSMNPYQGCEHGCAYCYARVTHEYWGYSAGMDFEQKILYKPQAAQLLEREILKKNYKPDVIVLSGNTDCYQPVERNLNLTRACLEVLLRYKHPVHIITKNALIERDIDLFKELAHDNLVRIHMSLNTTDEEVKQVLEPRTSSVRNVLRTIESFSMEGIPIYVLAMPIIPAINDHTIPDLIKKTSEAGAYNIYYQPVRLSKNLEIVFLDWLEKNFPDRKEKVIHRLEEIFSLDNGKKRINRNSQWMDTLSKQFDIYKRKYYPEPKEQKSDFSLFLQRKNPQLFLDFD